jgi:hypothetical protein
MGAGDAGQVDTLELLAATVVGQHALRHRCQEGARLARLHGLLAREQAMKPARRTWPLATSIRCLTYTGDIDHNHRSAVTDSP